MANIDLISETIADRKTLILYLNTGTTSAPVWSALGSYVTESAMDFDWGDEQSTDILGVTHSTIKPPTITQQLQGLKPIKNDAAVSKIWRQAIRDQDVGAMCNNDVLVVHVYSGASSGSSNVAFAERYPNTMIKPSSLGGSNTVDMDIDVAFGGQRSVGTATVEDGVVTFTAGSVTA